MDGLFFIQKYFLWFSADEIKSILWSVFFGNGANSLLTHMQALLLQIAKSYIQFSKLQVYAFELEEGGDTRGDKNVLRRIQTQKAASRLIWRCNKKKKD